MVTVLINAYGKRGGSMKFGMAVVAVSASLAVVNASATAAFAAQKSGTPTGNDVSYPQCGKVLPSGQALASWG